MSSLGLPAGAFLTSINGKQCTAVPKIAATSAASVPQTTAAAAPSTAEQSTAAPVPTTQQQQQEGQKQTTRKVTDGAPAATPTTAGQEDSRVTDPASTPIPVTSSVASPSLSPSPSSSPPLPSSPIQSPSPSSRSPSPSSSPASSPSQPPSSAPISQALEPSLAPPPPPSNPRIAFPTTPPPVTSSLPSSALTPPSSIADLPPEQEQSQPPLSQDVSPSPVAAPTDAAPTSQSPSIPLQEQQPAPTSQTGTQETVEQTQPTSQLDVTSQPPVATTFVSSAIATTHTTNFPPGLAGSQETSADPATRTGALVTGGLAPSTSNTTPLDTSTTDATGSQDGNGRSIPTAAIMGGVMGGVAFIFLLAFFLWWLRRRSLRKRHSTLLTPLTVPSTAIGRRRAEKRARVEVPDGNGSAPGPDTLRTVIGANINRFRGQVSSTLLGRHDSTPSVNMNRGTSQFMEQAPPQISATPFLDSTSATRRGLAESKGSFDDLLGAFSFNPSKLYGDPFSDTNAIPHASAIPAPLDPFGDQHAIKMTDKEDRGQGPPPAQGHESVHSMQTIATSRAKFRSDPFDLLRPESLVPPRPVQPSPGDRRMFSDVASDRSATAGSRHDSYTSKYTSGVNSSLGDWSDPGPDVGPAALQRAGASGTPKGGRNQFGTAL